MPATDAPTVVVGAGPAGLATSAAFVRAGQPVVLLERADQVGASWAARYDSLHLHTVRWLSGLPGLRIPRKYGRWVARDDLVRYLSTYAEVHRLQPELGIEVTRVDESPEPGAGWLVRTDHGDRPARRVVMTTGYSHTARRPQWPGVETFTGDLRHSADYREPSSYAGQDVLVVGAGNSATEIALDLLGAGARVTLSVRTPPNIVRRDRFGIPSQVFGIALKRLPAPVMDPLAAGMRRLTVPDLSAQGLPRTSNPYTQFRETGTVPPGAFLANLGTDAGGKRDVQVRGENEGIFQVAVTPAEHVALLVDLHVLETESPEFGRHILRAFGLMESGRGDLGDGDLRRESLLVRSLNECQRLFHVPAAHQSIIAEAR